MIKSIIFDYDGTISDTLDIKTNAFAEMYSAYGKEIQNKVIDYHLSHGGVSRFDKFRYFHKKLLNIKLNNSDLLKLVDQFSELVVNKVVYAPWIPGASQFIKSNFDKYKLFISTATPTNEIKEIVKRKKINKYFLDIYGSPEKKYDHISHIVSNYKLNNNEIIFIGDSNSDLNAAMKSKIKFVLVKNKFNSDLVMNYNGLIINNFNDLRL